MDQALKIFNFFLHLPVRWDDWSETWFKTVCILIRSQTLVSLLSVKDEMTHCVVAVAAGDLHRFVAAHALGHH